MNGILNRVSEIGLVPVVAINDEKKAVPLAKALIDGGLDVAEITFRTAAAEQSIKNIHEAFPDMLIGAGTVLSVEQVDKAVAAGASFIVTPGYNPTVVNYCVSKSIPIVPGCMDTNAIEMALEAGLDAVKFFPAEQAGGVKMMKALSGPYINLHFMPTGGVNMDNLLEYLAFKKIFAVGGSWMVKGELIDNDRFDEITKLTKEAIEKMLNFRVVHVGLNFDKKTAAKEATGRFSELFGFKEEDKTSSTFSSDMLELTWTRFPGMHGHIAIGTGDVKRAMHYLSKKGVEFDMSTAKYKGERMTAVYLKEEIGGFAIHLVEK